MRKSLLATFSILLILLTYAEPTYAYLDPGTGSMLLQGLIAGIAMISVTIKVYWYKFIGLFRKSEPEESEAETDAEPSKQEQT